MVVNSEGDGPSIDLNSDVGEGFGSWRMGDDEQLLDVVSSINIACGFHAGDPVTMDRLCRLAAERGVAIGAHVSYRDLHGFGRRFIDVEPDVLEGEVMYQLAALAGIARANGTAVSYVKPHGALYNTCWSHERQSAAVATAVARIDPGLTMLGQHGSQLLTAAEAAGLPTASEAFADRGLLADGTLVPRGRPGAVITDADEVSRQALDFAFGRELATADGSSVRVQAVTVCLHGDTPGALALARAVRSALDAAGVAVRAFAA